MSVLAALGLGGVAAFNAREIGRKRPILRNAKRANRALDAALDKRVDQIKPGATLTYGLKFAEPQDIGNLLDVARDSSKLAGSTPATAPVPGININPNADRVYLAHEMGHLASQQTDIGRLVNNLRHNPQAKKALLGAMVGIPAVASALEAGDEDLDSSLALAALANAPTLVDEGLASKNALAIMDTAGMRASLGQRGKLAGGLLSYAALPLIAGLAGNTLGNQFDQDL